MHDLNTIQYLNHYAAEVERLKANDGPGGELAQRTWPSDAPAISRRRQLSPEDKALKSWNRRLALLRSAQKRKQAQRDRVQACCARVLASDSLSARQALVLALAEGE
jgi:hypothetical protein